jgi:hypothetical protein
MKNKRKVVPFAPLTQKPPKAEISDAEFRKKLKSIVEWRKQRLAEIRTKNPR